MCEHWHTVTNHKLLATALMVASMEPLIKFKCGGPIKLWENHPGSFVYTFSYFDVSEPDIPIYHWHSSLVYYASSYEASEAMANFVHSLNVSWFAKDKPNEIL